MIREAQIISNRYIPAITLKIHAASCLCSPRVSLSGRDVSYIGISLITDEPISPTKSW